MTRVNIDDYWGRTTMDIICSTAFGYDLDSIRGNNEEVGDALSHLMASVGDFKNMVPGYAYLNAFMMRPYRNIVNKVFDDAIAQQRSEISSTNFLADLLNVRTEDGKELSLDVIRNNLLMMFLAGFDWSQPFSTQKLRNPLRRSSSLLAVRGLRFHCPRNFLSSSLSSRSR